MDDAAAGSSEDYVIATGQQISVREFVRMSAWKRAWKLALAGKMSMRSVQ